MTDLNLSMFKAYDIRTPSSKLTDELNRRLVRAEAVYFKDILKVPGVLLAHEARTMGPHYVQMAAEEFTKAGLNVVVIPGVASTCMFYYSAMRHPELAGIMCGASHNPAGDNGQKILGPKVLPIAEHIGPEGGLDKIKELYINGASTTGKLGSIRPYDPTNDYIDYSMKIAGVTPGSLKGVKVLHDYVNGAAGREMMLAFAKAGADLTPIHFVADGRFPLGDPNPVKAAVIKHGLETLKAGDYLLGTFFDGDGDRIDFYRGDGSYLSSSFVYAAILPLIRERFSGAGVGVFADLKSNPLAIMEMARTGASVNVCRNGHSQIKNAMAEDKRMFGTVEESAHFYESFLMDGGRYCSENTLYLALLTTRAWKENPARFDELFAIQARTSREREWGYKFSDNDKRAAALEAVQKHFEGKGLKAQSRMPNGYDLEATMMRGGLPFEIGVDTKLSPDWLQVCQRTSQSENGLARWEAVSGKPEIVKNAKKEVAEIVAKFGAGEEYQG